MTALVAVIFPYATTADAAAQDVLRLDPDLAPDAGAVATVSCDDDGAYRLTTNYPTEAGDDQGLFWFLVFNALVLLPTLGGLSGLGRRALTRRLTEAGIDRSFQRSVGEDLGPGTSALFLRLESAPRPGALEPLERFAGSSHITLLNPRAEGVLAEALYSLGSETAFPGLERLDGEPNGPHLQGPRPDH